MQTTTLAGRAHLAACAILAVAAWLVLGAGGTPVETRDAQAPQPASATSAAPQASNIVPGTPTMTAAGYDALFQANNNWGRWGKDDRLGTTNLITAAKRKQAAALVKEGLTVSIAHDLSTETAVDNPMRSDVQTYNYHGGFSQGYRFTGRTRRATALSTH